MFLRILFNVPLNDFTNAFKAYRSSVIEGCRPFLSPHFNLTIELPLKTIVRGYSLDGNTDHMAKPAHRGIQTEAEGDGQPLFVYYFLLLA